MQVNLRVRKWIIFIWIFQRGISFKNVSSKRAFRGEGTVEWMSCFSEGLLVKTEWQIVWTFP